MPVYNSFAYGDGTLYGTDYAVEAVVWSFQVYWNDQFVEEGTRLLNVTTSRGRDHFLATSGGWERFRPGEVTATLDNSDGRYDPYNTSSPLYGYLRPGRVVRVSVSVTPAFLPDATTFQIMRGVIDDIQTTIRDGQRTTRIIVKDGLEWLTRRSASLGVQEDAEAMDIAEDIALAVGFDAVDDWSVAVIGTDSAVIPISWVNSNNALEVIEELCDVEMGQVFHAADGTLTLVCGDYTQAQTTDLDEAEILQDVETKQPWEVVRTRAQVTSQIYTEGSPAVLWSFGSSGQMATWTATTVPSPGSTPYYIAGPVPAAPGVGNYLISVDAIFEGENGFTTPSVDYDVVQERPGQTWDDANADPFIGFSQTDIGNGLRLRWTNAHSYVGETNYMAVFWIEITASPYEPGDPIVSNAEDQDAIDIYGEKTFTLSNNFLQDPTYAQLYANYIVSELGAGHIFVTVQIEGRGLLQFSQELYTSKIALTIPTLGIDATFRVGKIEHSWRSPNGFLNRTVLKLEPVLTSWDGA